MGSLLQSILAVMLVLSVPGDVVTVHFVNCSAATRDQVEVQILGPGPDVSLVPEKAPGRKAVELSADVEYTIVTVDKRRDIESRMETKAVFSPGQSNFVIDERGMYGQLDGLVSASPACP